MRLLFGVMLGLGFFTGCGEVKELQNVKVEAVESGFSITDENGAEELVSKVEYSMEPSVEGGVASMDRVGTMAICCKSCVFVPETGEITCYDCKSC